MLISLSPTQIVFVEKSDSKSVHYGKQRIWPINNQQSPNNGEYSLSILDEVFSASKDRSALSLILANQYVRYLVLPGLPANSKKNVIEQYTKHAFIEAYGEVAGEWQIVINPFNHGKSVMACATPSKLINELLLKCKQLNIKVNTIQPYLMAGFNLLRKKENRAYICFVQAEAGGYLVALIADETWVSVNYFKQAIDDNALLTQTVKREMLIANWEDQPVSILSMGFSKKIQLNKANWKHERIMPKYLKASADGVDVSVLMALSGKQ